MNKKIFLCLFLAILILPSLVMAQSPGGIACTHVKNFMTAIYTIAVTLVVVGWVIAGILWLTSMGSTERTGTAKKATTAAIIGTTVVLVSGIAAPVIASLLSIQGGLLGC